MTREMSTTPRLFVTLDTSPGSAFAAIGATIRHTPSCFLSVVSSPIADLTWISSSVSAWRDAKTLSFLGSASLSVFFAEYDKVRRASCGVLKWL